MNERANATARLTAYVELLALYNGALNLLSEQGLRDVERLLADGRSYATLIEALAGSEPTVVDVGSGAGFPGVVIAAMLPRAKVHLVERRRRRAAFLELAVGAIGLANATVFSGDVERLDTVCAHVVTAQAVTTLAELIRLTRHVHRHECFVISRRGPAWREELGRVELAVNAGAPDQARQRAGAGTVAGGTAEDDSAVAVVAERDLDQSGSLVALRLTGGPACRSSG